ncbi:capsule biosynthesis protein [bacterium]|nr:capsule biosynthesis protein [bacterium]|tara:strand:- start:1604 stop:1804 length:201 start_codon:yes stop_codon:yes gene_type:complete
MTNIFNKHLKEVGETYFEHLIEAWRYSLILFRLFLIAFIHGILPFIFKKTVSEKIIKMGDELKNRN